MKSLTNFQLLLKSFKGSDPTNFINSVQCYNKMDRVVLEPQAFWLAGAELITKLSQTRLMIENINYNYS